MKRSLLIIVLFFSHLLNANAQQVSLNWMKQIGSPGQNLNGHFMDLDSGKYIYISGYFTSTADFDPGPGVFNMTSNGGTDIYVAKFDSAGNFIWAKQIGGTLDEDVTELKVDKRGNIVFIGYFQGTVDMDPGPGVVTVTSNGSNSFFTKLDHNGNFIWSKQLLLAGSNTMEIDPFNNIYIGGDFAGSFDFDPGPGTQTLTAPSVLDNDLFILKLNEQGEFLWARNMNNGGGSQLQEHALETDQQGSVYMAGNFSGPMDFDPGPSVATLTTAGSSDCFIVSLDSSGNYRWAKRWGAANTDKPFDMAIDPAGNIFATGSFDGLVDFDPNVGVFTMNSSSFRNCFLLKLDQNGNFIFARQFTGNSFGEAVAFDSGNNIYVSGGFYGPADFDPGPGVSSVDGGNIFVTRLDAAGNLTWVAAFQNQIVGSYESVYVAMKVDPFKNVYYTGVFPFAVDFDPGPGTYIATPIGNNDIPIVKLNGQCRTASTSLNVTTCDRYTLNGTTYTNSGTYVQTLSGSGGCDSLVTINLTITRIQTQDNASSCGSYTWNGTTYSASGVYNDTLTAVNGCDSIVQLTLTIRDLPVPNLGANTAICDNDVIALYPGAFDSYQWNNASNLDSLLVTSPGTYWVTVTSNGCQATDSITIDPKAGCPPTECTIEAASVFYPNPCGNTVYFDKNNTSCSIYLNLYNALGQCILKNELLTDGTNTISMKRFAAGTYFYTLHDMSRILKRGKLVKGRL
ncbi:MAG: T9SS type A sorting domain-containing protein [Ferruginibacter sp.]